jgi:hypothetical protein
MRWITLIFLLAAACGGTRTSAATQPSPVAFDPATSEPRALEVVEQMLPTLGGAEAWEAVKQICWTQKYHLDGELKSWVKHCWDRWNGRHRFEVANMASVQEAEASGRPGDVIWQVAMYDLFDRGRGWAGQGHNQLDSASTKKMIEDAYKRWQLDAYQIAMLYKLEDPGVKLAYFGEIDQLGQMNELCKPVCDTVKVEYDPEVGSDVYYVHVNRDSKLPQAFERRQGEFRIGYAFSDWIEAGGLKWPGKLQNIGLPGEVMTIEDVQIDAPDDSLYIPAVR